MVVPITHWIETWLLGPWYRARTSVNILLDFSDRGTSRDFYWSKIEQSHYNLQNLHFLEFLNSGESNYIINSARLTWAKHLHKVIVLTESSGFPKLYSVYAVFISLNNNAKVYEEVFLMVCSYLLFIYLHLGLVVFLSTESEQIHCERYK